jgi:hypothetical protein
MPYGMSDAEWERFTSGQELPLDEAYRLRELKQASVTGGRGRPDVQALQAAQLALDRAPQQQPTAPAGMPPAFYNAMVSAGAPPLEMPTATPQPPPTMPPPLPVLAAPPHSLPQIPAPASAAPVLPPIGASIQQLPQQAPVMSQVSPAPAVAAKANINNDIEAPVSIFSPASQRPSLPKIDAPNLAPNLGAYASPPPMPGYGLPRTGQPFRPAAPPGLPTFAAFSQPTGLPTFPGSSAAGFAPPMPSGNYGPPVDMLNERVRGLYQRY